MPLVTCPDCHHEVSDAASACANCGRPMSPTPTDGPRCTRCGSGALQALSLVHQMGTASIALSGTTVGLDVGLDGGAGLLGAAVQANGTTRTMLSTRVAPPSPAVQRWRAPLTILIGVAVVIMGAGRSAPLVAVLATLGGGTVAGWLVLRERRRVVTYNRTEYVPRMQTWRTSAMCLVCGNVQRLGPSPAPVLQNG